MAVLLALILIYGGAAVLQAPAGKPPAATAAEDPAYKLLLENESARVFLVSLEPKQATSVHEHQRDLMLVAAGHAQFTLLGGQGRMQMASGDVQVLTGARRHSVRNDGPGPLRLVIIELSRPFDPQRAVCGLGERPCGGEMGGSLTQGAFVYSILFETDSYRVVDVSVDPRAAAENFPIKGEHLLVPVTAMRLRHEGQEVTYSPGQAFWAAAGLPQRLENVGDQRARWVAIEVR